MAVTLVSYQQVCRAAVAVFFVCVPLSISTFAQDNAAPATPSESASSEAVQAPAALPTVEARIGIVQTELKLDGTFVPKGAAELQLDLKAVATLRVVEAVPHGKTVQQGDMLVRFDADDVKEQVEAQERTVASLKIGLEEALREAKLAELQEPLDREQAELNKKQADEDFRHFQEIEKDQLFRDNDQRLKNAKDNLDYTAEELNQLEKMYKADDLTEESEEIVLRRARDDLDRSKFAYEQSERYHRRMKVVELPRMIVDRERAYRLAMIAYERFQATHPLNREKQSQALAKQKIELDKAIKTLDDLRADLKSCTIAAPISGVVYYGRELDGKWSPIADMRAKLKPHGSVSSHETFMTIVPPESLEWISSVSEADLAKLRVGLVGRLTPNAFKSARIDATIKSVGSIPTGENSFEVVCELGKLKEAIVAGMTGALRLVTYYQPKAVVVPSKAIFEDDNNGEHYVWVLVGDGKPTKKVIEAGVIQGEDTEVRSGLVAGDKVLTQKPNLE